MRVLSRALDGGLLDVQADGLIGPVSSAAVARSEQRQVSALHIASGGPGFGESSALDPQLGRETQLKHEVEIHGGRLRIWSGLQPIGPDEQEYAELSPSGAPSLQPVHFAVWDVEAFELLVIRYARTAEDLLALFEDFVLSRGPQGLECIPVDPSVFWFSEPASVILDLPDVGIAEVSELAARAGRAAPRYPGTAVAGGELYVEREASQHTYFVHVSDSTITHLSPFDSDNVQPAIDLLGTMQISWRR